MKNRSLLMIIMLSVLCWVFIFSSEAANDPAKETVLIGVKTVEDQLNVTVEIEPAKAMWMPMDDMWMESVPSAKEIYHFEVKPMDPWSKTRLSYSKLHFTAENTTTGDKVEADLHPMWGGSGLHYAANGALLGDGEYKVTVTVDPPTFARGSSHKDIWLKPLKVEMPFTMKGGLIISEPLMEEKDVPPLPSGGEKEFHVNLGERQVDDNTIVKVELEDSATMWMLMDGMWMERSPKRGDIHFEVKLTDTGSKTRIPYTDVKLTVIHLSTGEKVETELHPMWGSSGLHYSANGALPAGGSGTFKILVDVGQARFARSLKDKDKWMKPIQAEFEFEQVIEEISPDIEIAREATEKYKDINVALADGYDPGPEPECVFVPGLGGMGIHYVNFALIDENFDPAKPEALMYSAEKELLGVEYIVISKEPLTGFDGVEFAPMPPEEFPENWWGIHVWLYKENPSGLFAPFNPDVKCPTPVEEAAKKAVEIWVSNQKSNKVQVLNDNLEIIAEIDASGAKPHMGSFTSDGKFFYSANVGVEGPGKMVDKIDVEKKKIVETFSIDFGMTHATVVRPGDREVWLNNMSDAFHVIDKKAEPEAITATVAMPKGSKPVCMAFTADGNKMYVSSQKSGTFDLVDPNTKTFVKTIATVGGYPCGLVLDRSGTRMLATVGVAPDGSGNLVGYIDVATDKFVNMTAALPPGTLNDPHAIIETLDGKEILLGNRNANELLFLDTGTFKLLATIPVGHPVDLIDLDPNGKFAYAALRHFGVAKIDIEERKVVKTIELGGDPHGLLIVTPIVKEEIIEEKFDKVFFMQLESGLNMISLPLKPQTPYTARRLMDELGATVVIKLDAKRSRFVGFTVDAPGDGFPIEGGKGYIVNVKEGKTVTFVGAAWTNEPPIEAAPSVNPRTSAWAFIVSGRLLSEPEFWRIRLQEIVSDNYIITVKNLRTGAVTTDAVDFDAGRFNAVWADLNRKSVVQVGDTLEIVATDTSGKRVVGSIRYTVSFDDIQKAFASLKLRLGDIIPLRNALLQNYPNPFNPETWIPYELASRADVVIHIYDSSGQLTRRIDLGNKDAGYYVNRNQAAYWDGKNSAGEKVASGIYFYSIEAGKFRAIRKMVVVK